ncbi:MAG: tetratricopeptide repeat protein [Acidobacteria bacterium]|nr:tetratricopeptide repeat protein [Acidobacteriota bacterium]
MKTLFWSVAFSLLILTGPVAAGATGPPQASPAAPARPSGAAATADAPVGYTQPDPAKRAEAYSNFTMGHLNEEFYDATSHSEYANLAIEFYKKAYELDPKSPVIGEHLAEIYFKAQRIRDAVLEAQEILKHDADNLPARRLLARIYVRTLGDLSGAAGQRETVGRAIEQYREILRVDPSDTEAALWLARLHRLQNDREKAEKALRGVLEREPENEPAIEQLTQLLLDQGKSMEAIALLERIEKRSPTPGLLDLLGDAYTQVHNSARAEQAYRKAVELDPAEASHRRGLAQSLLAQEKYAPALEQYKKLVELEPDDPDNYLRLAQIYRQLRQLDRAEENLLHAKQRAPGSLEVIYYEAMIYEAQGRFSDAIRVLSDAVVGVKSQSGVSPTSRRTLAILYEQLGRLYRDVENYSAAVNTFQEMLKLGEEEDRRARVLIIDTHRANRDLPRALETSRKALELYPKDRSIRVTSALLLGEKGDTDEAARLLREMLAGATEDREIFLDLAQVYERGRRYAEAEAAARAAEKLAARPAENEMVWFLLGAIFERQKKHDLAENEFKRVLQLNPRNAPALNYYGYMLADLGTRLDEATELVKRALAEEPYNGAYLDSLGWAYFKQNRLAEAEGSLRKAVERNAHDPTIRDHLGDVYFKSGRIDLAASEWERALAEWRRALPTENEAEKVAALEQKLSNLKHRLAQQKPASAAKPQ